MEKPSNRWQATRLAVLDRTHRTVLEPFEPLYTIYALVCVYYLFGFVRVRMLDEAVDIGLLEGFQILSAATAGVLVLPLNGSVLLLAIANRRFRKLK